MKINSVFHQNKWALITWLSLVMWFCSTSAWANDSRPLSCHQNIQISVGPSGMIVLTPEMMLSDTFSDYSPFTVSINGRGGNILTCDDIGKPIMVTVTDTRNNNSCWSNVSIEDKLPPRIFCRNDTLPCYVNPDTVDYSIYATATDNCDDDVEIFMSYIIDDFFCDRNFSSRVDLVFIATDNEGLMDTCRSSVYFEKVDINTTEFPLDTTLYCPIIDTLDLGVPLIDSLPINLLCEYVTFFRDDTMPGRCSGEFTIMREWTVMDWCPGGLTLTDIQEIMVLDSSGPVIQCPDTITVGTEADRCIGLYIIQPLQIADACGSGIMDTTFMGPGGRMYNTGDTIELERGFYDFVCTATDSCGNTSTCEKVVKVIDNIAPSLVCIPEIDIYLDSMGYAEMCIEDFDHHKNFYFDNCGIDSITIGKMDELCDSIHPEPLFCLTFCCEEVLQEVMIVITVKDSAGNENFCMINTNVLDTIPPEITESPNDTTISCTTDYRDTSLTGGRVVIEDNCLGILNLKIVDSVDIDVCKEGEVTRYFIACDPSGNADTAIQIITIVNNFIFDVDSIVWFGDTCIESCPVDSLPETIGGMPIIKGDSCDVVLISYTDSIVQDPDTVCLVIARTWTVRNECRDTVMVDSTQIITIKNYRPPVLSGPPADTTVNVGPDSCTVFIRLPELVATDCSTGLTVTNDCTGGGAIVARVFPVGRKVITYTATDACGNISTYQTIVTVQDLLGPGLTCPSDTTVNCNTPTDTATLGSPVAMDNCEESGEVSITFNDVINAGTCPQEFTIVRTFTATDSSGNTSTCVQNIMIQDTVGPVIICPSDTMVNCESSISSMNLGLATASDQCQVSVNSITERDSIVAGNCVQEFEIFRIFTATDSCGNSSSCIQTIIVVDTTGPDIVCPPDIVVSCSDQTDPMNTGFPTVTDNCAMGLNPTLRDSIVPGTGQTLRIIFRRWTVSDNCGNEASCEQMITVRDIQPPTIICPNDTTVECGERIDSLELFGSVNASDNCSGLIILSDTIYDLNICNVGTITRIFTAIDSVGNQSSCEQVITLVLSDTLKEEDITWPDSVINVDACMGISPDSMFVGMPEIDSMGASCFLLSVTFVDSADYNCVPGVCTTLTRKWTVIDSCQLDTTGQGIFCFTQEIRVVDTMKPVITGIMTDTVYLHPDSMCDAYFNIVAEADDCSGIRSITNNGRFGGNMRDTASGRYPRGLTPVTFIAEDSCCNADTQLIFIVVLDTIPPMISCRDSEKKIRGERPMETAEFCVSELIITATDNCDSDLDLRISFDPNNADDTCRVYNCDSLMGQPFLIRRLTLYISDLSGNQVTCVSTITVRDPDGVCSGGIIGGLVKTPNGLGIEEAQVELMGMSMQEMTDKNGAYSFGEMDKGQGYELQTSRNEDDPLNGITVKDVIMIQRHLLGMKEFTSPYQLLAADANASASIEVRDMIELKKLILGKEEELRYSPPWYFVDALYAFDDIKHPLDHPSAFEYKIDTLVSHMNIEFVGVKVGDVDMDAKVNRLQSNKTRSQNEVIVNIHQKSQMRENETGLAYIDFETDLIPAGWEFSLDFDDDLVKVNEVRLTGVGTSSIEYYVDQGRLVMIWTDALNEVNLTDMEILIQYDEIGNAEGSAFKLSEFRSKSLYDHDLVEFEMKETDLVMTNEGHQLILEQNKPNPFSGKTLIELYLPFDEEITFQVYEAGGRMVVNRKYAMNAGWNHIEVNADDLENRGMFLYKVISNAGLDIKRMLLVE